MEKVVREESSLPLSARVPIVDLAEMVYYWEGQGVVIRSMSQLVSWTVSAMVEVLKANGKVKREDFTVAEANRVLELAGLYQSRALERGRKKLSTALAFENMRIEGFDPRSEFSRGYNTLHREGSVDSLPRTTVDTLSEEERREIGEWHKKAMEVINKVDVVSVGERASEINLEKISVVKEKMTDEEFEQHMKESEESYKKVSDEDIINALRNKVVK